MPEFTGRTSLICFILVIIQLSVLCIFFLCPHVITPFVVVITTIGQMIMNVFKGFTRVLTVTNTNSESSSASEVPASSSDSTLRTNSTSIKSSPDEQPSSQHSVPGLLSAATADLSNESEISLELFSLDDTDNAQAETSTGAAPTDATQADTPTESTEAVIPTDVVQAVIETHVVQADVETYVVQADVETFVVQAVIETEPAQAVITKEAAPAVVPTEAAQAVVPTEAERPSPVGKPSDQGVDEARALELPADEEQALRASQQQPEEGEIEEFVDAEPGPPASNEHALDGKSKAHFPRPPFAFPRFRRRQSDNNQYTYEIIDHLYVVNASDLDNLEDALRCKLITPIEYDFLRVQRQIRDRLNATAGTSRGGFLRPAALRRTITIAHIDDDSGSDSSEHEDDID